MQPQWDRAKKLPAISAVMLVAVAGCAIVDPQPDYNETAERIKRRLAVAEVYDPAAEAQIEHKTQALLADGLTVADAVSVALLNNRGLQSKFLEIGVSRADVVQSQLLTNPSFSLSARFPEGGGRSNLTFGLGQELVDLWQIPVRRRIAEAQLEQVVLSVAARAVELTADVKSRCYRVLALRRAEEITRENLDLVQRTLDLAEARFEGGETTQLDVNLVKANLLDVQIALIGVQRDRRLAELGLARSLGLSRWQGDWALQDDLPMADSVTAEDAALVAWAMRERLDSRVAAMEVRQADGELRRQYLNLFPSVTAGLETERTERRALPGRKILADMARASTAAGQLTAPDIESRGQRDLERRQIIDSLLGPTLSITLPIWDQNQAQIAKAQFKVSQKRKDFEDALDRIADEVSQAAVAKQTATELLRFYEDKGLPQARTNLDAAKQAYEGGEQSILALIEAQETLIRQQRAYIDVLGDYAVALAELERAVGGRFPSESENKP